MKQLHVDIGVFVVNTICTLRCKNCITMTPYHKDAVHLPKEQICKDIDVFFNIFERVGHLDFEGGETLLHPQMLDIVQHALKYKERFGRIHILTNGTIVPQKELLEVCQNKNILFLIDDYGPTLSVRKEEVCKVLDQSQIEYRIDPYWGNEQYFGGWVDLGDTTCKNYTKKQLRKVYSDCRSGGGKYPYVKNGKMFVCQWQAAMMKHIPLIKGEFVDLADCADRMQIEETIERWQDHPVESCHYCNGFCVNAQRIPAAVQLTQQEFADPATKIAQVDVKS